MKKISLFVLLATMQVSFGGKRVELRKSNTNSTNPVPNKLNNFLKIIPTSAQIKDYISWWSLIGLGSYGMYWGLQKYGFQFPGISTPGQMVWGTAAGIAGVYSAQTGRDAIHTCYQLIKSYKSLKELKQEQTTWQSYVEVCNQKVVVDVDKEFWTRMKSLAAFSAAALITSWSIIYNPWGFKIINDITTKNNIWTKTVFPIATNALIAQGGYYVGSKLLSFASPEED